MGCILFGRLLICGWMLSACVVVHGQDELTRLPPLEDEAAVEQIAPPAAETNPHEDEAEAEEIPAADNPDPDAVEQSVDETIAPPWYSPDVIFDREIWESSFQIGINGTTGNTETMSFRVGADTKHKTANNTLAVSMNYARTQANGRETQNNALLTVRDDWDFANSPWSMFVRETTEYDEFKAYDMRVAIHTGFGYYFFKHPRASLKGRFGSGASREIGGPNDDISPEAVFGADIESKLTARQTIEATMDYLPEWGKWDDYRFQSRASWAIQLATDANLSLKLSVYERYDSTPEGRRPDDLDYALLLLWKL